jgi:tetratricopeptide (TPR) repeat protein
MMAGKSMAWLLLLILPAGFTGVWRLQRKVNVERDAMYQEQDEVLVRSPKLMKLVTLEYGTLAADIYWTRAVQYYGSKHLGQDTNLESLWPLLDVATTLDANLLPAYRFGALFLGEPEPRGAGRPDLAVQLLERGLKANPDYWRLNQDLGNVYYLELKDYAKAGQAYLEGSKKPGAQAWMKIMAARFLEKGDSRDTAAILWTELFNSSSDAAIKENARVNLQLLRADEDIEHLNAFAQEFAARVGRPPKSIGEIVQSGLIPGVPADPAGHPYTIGSDGKAAISGKSPLFKEKSVYQRPL